MEYCLFAYIAGRQQIFVSDIPPLRARSLLEKLLMKVKAQPSQKGGAYALIAPQDGEFVAFRAKTSLL